MLGPKAARFMTGYSTLKAMVHEQDVVEAEGEEAKHQPGADWREQ